MRRRGDLFQTIRTEGGLLPPELLKRIAEGDRELPGIAPADYHLEEGARLSEAVTRSWNRVRGAWESFRDARAKLAEGAPDAALTRDRWLLVLFQELGYGRLLAARGGLDIERKSYPISHAWNHTPIHLVGFRTELDKRTAGVAGAAKQSPHSLVQEFLNRSADQLWGFVSNGLLLRLLRDNASLTRQAFVEFDLEAMLDGDVYADFALLWLVCHQSRVEAERPTECWLERWVEKARDQGTRVLDRLRSGVETTIAALGRGFLAHPKNAALREALRSGALDKQDYYRELLRLVYRLLFLLVAEDRGLLLDPNAKPDAKSRYLEHYSTERLRRLVARRRGGPHPDGWRALRLVMAKLGGDAGCPDLALPPLGSFLWSRAAVPHLGDAELANEHLYEAVRALAFTEQDRLLRPVDWRNLDSEELGSVYESLLELHPVVDAGAAHFELSSAAGHERKTTGSYYTPDSLVQCLLDTALDPVLDEASKKTSPEQALLDLKVCDPACGSGHFLIAAARRMARRLAQVRTGDAEPDPAAMQSALRDVIGRCLYGVDVNPMAVELCKVSLWLEAIEPGKPLSFLEHQIQCGNSLLGATPALLAKGVPDDAFEPIEGDDKGVARRFKSRNRDERTGQTTMFGDFTRDATPPYWSAAADAVDLAALPDDSITAVHCKEEAYRRLATSEDYRRSKLLADAWCAAFVWQKTEEAPEPPTSELFRRLGNDPASVPAATRGEVDRIAHVYAFFHWHLAFPEVFRDPGEAKPESEKMGWTAGFDVVLSNPPWERITIRDKEWFSTRQPSITNAGSAAERRAAIRSLEQDLPELHALFVAAKVVAAGEKGFARRSGLFPLCGVGDVNLSSLFAELSTSLIGLAGRAGLVLPSAIATTSTVAEFFATLAADSELVSLYDFDNRSGLFEQVQGNVRFCLLTAGKVAKPAFRVAAFLTSVTDITMPDRTYELTVEDLRHFNPETLGCPMFASRRDAAIARKLYHAAPSFGAATGWKASIKRMFHMGDDSERFATLEDLQEAHGVLSGSCFLVGQDRFLPLYESKLAHQFNHRAATFDGILKSRRFGTHAPTREMQEGDLSVPSHLPLPRYWIAEGDASRKLGSARTLLCLRNAISATADSRSLIVTAIPAYPLADSLKYVTCEAPPTLLACLLACMNSFAVDYALRQKATGANASAFIIEQLPVLAPAFYESEAPWSRGTPLGDWIRDRVLELSYTAWDLDPWAKDLGWDGPPFRWDEPRRFLLRCEFDAAFFHLYAINRDDTAYILDTFPIVRRKDEATHGEYRTKRVILEIYDEMQRAIESGRAYVARLDPPPADPRAAHAARPESRSPDR